MWDAISDAYGEAVKSALPLHRLVIAIFALLAIAVAPNHEYKSIIESIARTDLSELEWGQDGVFANVTFGDILLVFALVFTGWCFSRLLLRLIFGLAAGSVDLKLALTEAAAAWPKPALDFETVKSQVEFLDFLIEPTKRQLRKLNAIAELFAAIGLGFLIVSYWGGALDSALGASSLLIAVLYHIKAVRIFLSGYIGPALHKSSILGRKLPSIADSD